jgi:hypothetical protein
VTGAGRKAGANSDERLTADTSKAPKAGSTIEIVRDSIA